MTTTAQGQPLNGYAQYQPYQPNSMFTENAQPYGNGAPSSTPDILVDNEASSNSEFSAESAFPKVASQPATQYIGGKAPTLVESTGPEMDASDRSSNGAGATAGTGNRPVRRAGALESCGRTGARRSAESRQRRPGSTEMMKH